MTISRHFVSLRTYALAFAVVLSPAFMQTSDLTCTPRTGDTTLSMLEFEVDGVNQIAAFTSSQRSYDVSTTSDTAIVRAQSTDPAATVDYQWWAGSTFLGSGPIGVGGGEVTLDVPVGQSALRIYVRPPGGAYAHYSVNVAGRDEFPCTEQGILDAIARGGGPHTFDCAGPTTVATTDTIVIGNDVILDGAGDLTVESQNGNAVWVSAGVTAELQGFILTHRELTPPLPRGSYGGGAAGIFNQGDLTLTNSTVSGNYGGHSSLGCGDRGCSYTGGGIINEPSGVLTLVGSTVEANVADFIGGIENLGTLTIADSTVSGNAELPPSPDAPSMAGGIWSWSWSGLSVNITNSTISDNDGVGIVVGELILANSTVSGNTGVGVSAEVLTATNNTVSGNGGTDLQSFVGPVTLANNIVDGTCFFLSAISLGYNIESPGNTCGFDQPTDQVDVTAAELNLGPLTDNGGPTMTHALLPGSVAIDWIPAGMCQTSEDQRGVMRPQGVACDVGAFELEVAP